MRASDLFLKEDIGKLITYYRSSINPPYSKKDIPAIAASVIILIFVPLTVIAGLAARSPAKHAAGAVIGGSFSKTPSSSQTLAVTQSLEASAGAQYPADTEIIAFLNLLNNYRSANGAVTLTPSLMLSDTAKWMASDMATNNYFSHTDSLGRDPFTRLNDFGYIFNTWKGENLVAAAETAQQAFDALRASAEHNEILLNPNYTAIGIWRAYNPNSGYGWYWASEFGGYIDTAVTYVAPAPPSEICDDGIDNDGDGSVDEGCPPPAISPCAPVGDVNGDGLVKIGDAQKISRFSVNLETLTAPQQWNADVNADGKVSVADAQKISRFLIGLETTFRACSRDTDGDAFLSQKEAFMGTDPWRKCPVSSTAADETFDALSADLNDDKVINVTDRTLLELALKNYGSGIYNRRYDLNADGKINVTDRTLLVLKIKETGGLACIP